MLFAPCVAQMMTPLPVGNDQLLTSGGADPQMMPAPLS
jgi:hypothetical protein